MQDPTRTKNFACAEMAHHLKMKAHGQPLTAARTHSLRVLHLLAGPNGIINGRLHANCLSNVIVNGGKTEIS